MRKKVVTGQAIDFGNWPTPVPLFHQDWTTAFKNNIYVPKPKYNRKFIKNWNFNTSNPKASSSSWNIESILSVHSAGIEVNKAKASSIFTDVMHSSKDMQKIDQGTVTLPIQQGHVSTQTEDDELSVEEDEDRLSCSSSFSSSSVTGKTKLMEDKSTSPPSSAINKQKYSVNKILDELEQVRGHIVIQKFITRTDEEFEELVNANIPGITSFVVTPEVNFPLPITSFAQDNKIEEASDVEEIIIRDESKNSETVSGVVQHDEEIVNRTEAENDECVLANPDILHDKDEDINQDTSKENNVPIEKPDDEIYPTCAVKVVITQPSLSIDETTESNNTDSETIDTSTAPNDQSQAEENPDSSGNNVQFDCQDTLDEALEQEIEPCSNKGHVEATPVRQSFDPEVENDSKDTENVIEIEPITVDTNFCDGSVKDGEESHHPSVSMIKKSVEQSIELIPEVKSSDPDEESDGDDDDEIKTVLELEIDRDSVVESKSLCETIPPAVSSLELENVPLESNTTSSIPERDSQTFTRKSSASTQTEALETNWKHNIRELDESEDDAKVDPSSNVSGFRSELSSAGSSSKDTLLDFKLRLDKVDLRLRLAGNKREFRKVLPSSSMNRQENPLRNQSSDPSCPLHQELNLLEVKGHRIHLIDECFSSNKGKYNSTTD